MRALDLADRTFGRLTVVRRSGSLNGFVAWECECTCGQTIHTTSRQLISGKTTSCGCQQGIGPTRHGQSSRKSRGGTPSPEYQSWKSMLNRCYRPSNIMYYRYGGRGIVVCDTWRQSFPAFLADMGSRPEGTELHRIDNDKGYEPGNCAWARRPH